MSSPSRVSAFLVAFVLLGAMCGGRVEPVRVAAAPTPECVRWATEARYRPYGYDHIVHIHNGCAAVAECVVTTDVNPSPTRATIPAHDSADVVTWVGSPVREFTATVSCFLRSTR